MNDYTTFFAVQLNELMDSNGYMISDFTEVMSELTEHLSMNGYTFDTNGDGTIFIREDELAYLKTILEDRELMYTVL